MSSKQVELRELIDYVQPTNYIVKSTEYRDEYETPVITPGKTFILGYTNETDGIYYASPEKPVIIFDDFTTSFHWVDFNFKVKSSACKILIPKEREDFLFRYVFYSMSTISYDDSSHSRKWISKYSKLKISLPDLTEQERIVNILDKFSNYEKELEKELEQRNKQYNYYLDKLLS